MPGQADLFLDLDATGDQIKTRPGPERDARRARAEQPIVRLDPTQFEAAAQLLEQSGDYRVLRRLEPRPIRTSSAPTAEERIAIILDTETTGLDQTRDEVIELGMVAFSYREDGGIGDVVKVFSALQEPSIPISPEITRLTGITPEMVAGQMLDGETIERFIEPADLIIAHNARFDRPFCERLARGFAQKAWACSHSEVAWNELGFEGSKLGYLLAQCGWFHRGHRAVDDCHALLEILASPLPHDKGSPFIHLLASTRKARVRLWAEGSPYDLKDVLKKRGYRWNDGNDGQPKSWWIEIAEDACAAELEFLRREIYRRDVIPYHQRVTAFERYRALC